MRGLVRERLTAEIGYWDRRLGELWDEVARKPDVRVTINDFTRRRDDLDRRLERRMEELDRELELIPAPPNVVGAALIVPAGMLAQCGRARSRSRNARRPSRRAPRLARGSRTSPCKPSSWRRWTSGNDPRDVSKHNLGYDVESKDKETGRLRMIEVKGRVKGATTVTITRNEIVTALNKPRTSSSPSSRWTETTRRTRATCGVPSTRSRASPRSASNHDLKKLLAIVGASVLALR